MNLLCDFRNFDEFNTRKGKNLVARTFAIFRNLRPERTELIARFSQFRCISYQKGMILMLDSLLFFE